MALPVVFLEEMKERLGEEWTAYEAALNEKPWYGLRVNTAKVEVEAFLALRKLPLFPVDWCKEGFSFDAALRPAKHPHYHAGLYYLQEPSAMSPAALLPLETGDKVLDLCAAPGGKTTQLAARMKGNGILFSNDISAGRTKAVVKNVEQLGFRNVIITSETPKKLAEKLGGFFDKILVDAPCSGEGMFRKEPDVAKSWNEEMRIFCENSQREILTEAAKLLKDGGMLLYSTCTFSPAEDEGMIQWFLDTHPEFSLRPLGCDALSPGRPDWVEDGRAELSLCGRLWPHKHHGEGHFLALLEKRGKTEETALPPSLRLPKTLADYRQWEAENLTVQLDGLWMEVDGNLYCMPEETPSLAGLRVMRSGLLVGSVEKGRFAPSQALAMALRMEEAKEAISLPAEDERVVRYLKGETIQLEGENGWCLFGVDGFPLGWGKMQNGRLKNKYAKGWRME